MDADPAVRGKVVDIDDIVRGKVVVDTDVIVKGGSIWWMQML